MLALNSSINTHQGNRGSRPPHRGAQRLVLDLSKNGLYASHCHFSHQYIEGHIFVNIYLCSTVRNLLFAVLKALDEPAQQSYILMICDQQNIDTDNYDLSVLPGHVKVHFVNRKTIRKHLDSNISGRILRLLAAINIRTSTHFRRYVRSWLFNGILKESGIPATDDSQLFLFNDRNRIARLIRLAFVEYAIIEDGLANYYGYKLKPGEALWRTLTRHPFNRRYLGDDPRCHTIFLLEPDKAPQVLQAKIRPMTFINHQNIEDVCYKFFKLDDGAGHDYGSTWILATQPISVGQLTTSGFDLEIYRKIIDRLTEKNVPVALKVHPREDPGRYRNAFPDYQLLESKIPLELMILGASQKCNIVSIYSTAGMGFERYCRRITLIRDDESEFMGDTFSAWKKDRALLDNRINNLIP